MIKLPAEGDINSFVTDRNTRILLAFVFHLHIPAVVLVELIKRWLLVMRTVLHFVLLLFEHWKFHTLLELLLDHHMQRLLLFVLPVELTKAFPLFLPFELLLFKLVNMLLHFLLILPALLFLQKLFVVQLFR